MDILGRQSQGRHDTDTLVGGYSLGRHGALVGLLIGIGIANGIRVVCIRLLNLARIRGLEDRSAWIAGGRTTSLSPAVPREAVVSNLPPRSARIPGEETC